MKILNQILHPVKKFSKGMLALLTLNLIVVLSVFIFDSCKKAAYENSDAKQANTKFLTALEKNKKSITSVSFSKKANHNTMARSVAPASDEIAVYVQFPTQEVTDQAYSLYQNTESMQGIVDLVHEADAVIQYESTPTNSNYQINVPIETIVNSLNPLVQESKQYLYTKGFSEQDIQQMIAEENAEEIDLIPFVMALTRAENTQAVARNNYSGFFVNSAYARAITWSDAGACAVAALLGDFAGFAYGSSATVWSMAAMKTAFKSIAKKMFGPVGVAIAVAEFGICLTGVYLS